MDFPDSLSNKEFELFKKELRLTGPWKFEWYAPENRGIFTDGELEVSYYHYVSYLGGCWKLQYVRRLNPISWTSWASWESLGAAIVNIAAIERLELYAEDADAKKDR